MVLNEVNHVEIAVLRNLLLSSSEELSEERRRLSLRRISSYGNVCGGRPAKATLSTLVVDTHLILIGK
jgi:hypothetical protein